MTFADPIPDEVGLPQSVICILGDTRSFIWPNAGKILAVHGDVMLFKNFLGVAHNIFQARL